MRNFPTNSASFCNSVEKRILKMVHLDLKDLRSKVVNNTTFFDENLTFFDLRTISLDDFVRLGILCWYLPEELSYILREDLHFKMHTFEEEHRILCEQFLQSKAHMLLFLMETNVWHTRELFGNILNKNIQLDRFLRIRPKPKKAEKPQRKRGYDDHGSRVERHKWKPRHDYLLTKLQNEIERARIFSKETLQFIRGLLE